MKFSKLTSVFAIAGMLFCFAVTANAAEQNLTYEKDGTALSEYQYTTTSNETYTLSEDSKNVLATATDGDTLTITYNIESNGTARYRNGLKLAGKQFYINCHTESSLGSWKDKGDYHLNAKFVKNNSTYQSVTVKYVITLGAGGTASAVDAELTDGDSKTVSGSKIPLSSADINSFVLNTADRGSAKDNDCAKLTNFKAVLTTKDLLSVTKSTSIISKGTVLKSVNDIDRTLGKDTEVTNYLIKVRAAGTNAPTLNISDSVKLTPSGKVTYGYNRTDGYYYYIIQTIGIEDAQSVTFNGETINITE